MHQNNLFSTSFICLKSKRFETCKMSNNNKVSGKKEIIQCGMGASRDFLRLLNHEGLPLFNPFHGERNEGNHDRRNP